MIQNFNPRVSDIYINENKDFLMILKNNTIPNKYFPVTAIKIKSGKVRTYTLDGSCYLKYYNNDKENIVKMVCIFEDVEKYNIAKTSQLQEILDRFEKSETKSRSYYEEVKRNM